MLLGSIILPLMDAAAKTMGETIGSSTIVMARFVFQSLILLPFVWGTLYLPRGTELIYHIKRSMGLSAGTLCFFTAIQVMPIADALAVFFVMPLIVTLLAPWILGETVGWRRILAVAVGLIGAVIIIQPSQAVFGWRAILPLGTAIGFSFYLIYTRKLARTGDGGDVPALTMQFWSGTIGAVITAIAIITITAVRVARIRGRLARSMAMEAFSVSGIISCNRPFGINECLQVRRRLNTGTFSVY